MVSSNWLVALRCFSIKNLARDGFRERIALYISLCIAAHSLTVRGAIGLILARPWVWFDGAAGAESGGRESSTWVFCAI